MDKYSAFYTLLTQVYTVLVSFLIRQQPHLIFLLIHGQLHVVCRKMLQAMVAFITGYLRVKCNNMSENLLLE